MSKCLVFSILLFFGVYAIFYSISRYQYQARMEETSSKRPALTLDAFQAADSLAKNPDFLKAYMGKCVAISGVILTSGDTHWDTYFSITGGRRTDSGYCVAYPLGYDALAAQKTCSGCDSAILSYKKLYNMKEYAHKIIIQSELVGTVETIKGGITYNRRCPPYTLTTTKQSNYRLQYFCYETATLKGILYSVDMSNDYPRVFLENAVLLRREKTKK